MELKIYSCSRCVGENSTFIKFGKTKAGKQRFQCTSCKTTSILKFSYQAYRKNINRKIIQLTKEGMGIRGISRILKISTTTLLRRIISISEQINQPTMLQGKIYEVDELRTYINNKKELIWIVYALERESRKVVSFNTGKRTNETLQKVITSLTFLNAKQIFTDKLKNYRYIINSKIHIIKNRGINYIERKNLSLRTHLKRFNRKTICFSRNNLILNSILKIYFWG